VVSLLVDALGCARTSAALPTLHRLASHTSPDVRFTVATALSQCSVDFNSIAEPLLALSADPLAEVRWSAVYELCEWSRETSDERIADRLRSLLADDDACFHVYGPIDVPPL
jgi:HEAT repeat protein